MAGKIYQEPIEIKYNLTQSDGQGGKSVSAEALLYKTNAKISEGESRYSHIDNQRLGNFQIITFWNDPTKEITLAHWIEWRGKVLSIQSITLSDNRKQTTIKTVSK